MLWQDQSETLALPAHEALLMRLGAADELRLRAIDNALPRVVIASACLCAIRGDIDRSPEERGGLLLGRAYAGTDGAGSETVVAERSVASRASAAVAHGRHDRCRLV
jgi:hypothetical protein